MNSSRNYDSASAYHEEHESSENKDTFLKSKRRKDISFSYSILVNPSTHGNSDSDAGHPDYDTRVSKKSSFFGKRRGSAVTNTSYASDMSSSAGRSNSDYFYRQERVFEEKIDDMHRRYGSTDSGYPESSSQSSRLKRSVERQKMRDYDNDLDKGSKVRSRCREYRRTRQVRDCGSRGVPKSRSVRQAKEPPDHKEMVEQVRYKLAECSKRGKYHSPSRSKHNRWSRSSESNDMHKYESRHRVDQSRTSEDLRSPYKSPRRSTFRSPSRTPKHVNSTRRSSDYRSSSGERNPLSRSSSPVASRGRYRRKYSSRDNSPYRRREASSSERDLETVYRDRRKNRNHDSAGSPPPTRRRKNKNSVRDEKYRRSKARYSKRGSGDDEKSLSRKSDSYLGQEDQSTRSSHCQSRRSEKYYAPKRRDSSERYYSQEKYSRGRSSYPRHSHNSPHYRRRQSPEEHLKVSEWLPGCRLRNIEARGGKRDFRQWFTVLPPNVQVDQDLRTDRGVFKKDNFQSSQALDKYLGIVNSRSPVDRRKDNSRSPG